MAKYLDAQGVQYLVALIKNNANMALKAPDAESHVSGVTMSFTQSTSTLTYKLTLESYNANTGVTSTPVSPVPSTLTGTVKFPRWKNLTGKWVTDYSKTDYTSGASEVSGTYPGLVTTNQIREFAKEMLSSLGWTEK